MQSLSLPEEALLHDPVFEDMIVSISRHEDFSPIVTFIWGNPFNPDGKIILYTVLSIEYDPAVMDLYSKDKWLYELLARPRPMRGPHMRDNTTELFVAQSLAYDQVERIRKVQSHERTTGTGTSIQRGYGLEGSTVHRAA